MKKQIKFLLIASYPESVLKFRKELLQSILSHSISVHLISPRFSSSKSDKKVIENMGITIHELSLSRSTINPLKDIYSFIKILLVLKEVRPQYVLAYTIKPVIYGLVASRIAKVPSSFALITGLGYGFTGKVFGWKKVLRIVLHHMYKIALRNSSKVFFQNRDDKQLFEQLNISPQSTKNIVVNGSGVNLQDYPKSPLPEEASFLMISRLLVNKGVREYALAAERLKKVYPKVDFKLVGWIDENPDAIGHMELDEWVNRGVISYLGKLENVRPAIAKTSAYVLPSYREGTPRTVLEAMSMGRPIITTDAPGCRETVDHGVNGYLVPVKSVDALENAMRKLIINPKLFFEMGKESRRIVEEKYDVHNVNTFMLKEMGID